jgi:hypothetical protein
MDKDTPILIFTMFNSIFKVLALITSKLLMFEYYEMERYAKESHRILYELTQDDES